MKDAPAVAGETSEAGRLDAIGARLAERYGRWFRREEAAVLYHYTTPDGFVGIVSEGRLRASHIAYLNDSTEFVYALHLLEAAAARLGSAAAAAERDFLAAFGARMRATRIADIPGFYVLCLSRVANDLGQWRAYGGGEGGFCLGFDPARLDLSGSVPLASAQVQYDRRRQEEIAAELVRLALAEWMQADPGVDRERWIGDFVEAIAPVAAMLKNPAFAAEQEWRYVYMNPPRERIKVLAKPTMLSSYIDVPAGQSSAALPLLEVWIGPGRYGELSEVSARTLLERHGYGAAALRRSTVPFRVTV